MAIQGISDLMRFHSDHNKKIISVFLFTHGNYTTPCWYRFAAINVVRMRGRKTTEFTATIFFVIITIIQTSQVIKMALHEVCKYGTYALYKDTKLVRVW